MSECYEYLVHNVCVPEVNRHLWARIQLNIRLYSEHFGFQTFWKDAFIFDNWHFFERISNEETEIWHECGYQHGGLNRWPYHSVPIWNEVIILISNRNPRQNCFFKISVRQHQHEPSIDKHWVEAASHDWSCDLTPLIVPNAFDLLNDLLSDEEIHYRDQHWDAVWDHLELVVVIMVLRTKNIVGILLFCNI